MNQLIHSKRRTRTIRYLLLAVECAALAGCSAEAYKRSADLQVHKILADRKQTALGYQPQTDAPTTVSKVAPREAFASIPVTPLAPPEPPAIRPSGYDVPFAPLGPRFNPEQVGASTTRPSQATSDGLGVEAANRGANERLRLGPPLPSERPIRLDLYKSLEYAVQHSRQYQDRAEQVYLAALNVTLERHLFEPRPFVNQSVGFDGGQADVDYRSALTATTNAGVRQRLPYGGEVVASALVSFVDALNRNTESGETAQLALTGSIPLLRGAGMVNLEPLIQSERSLVYQVRGFEDYRRQFAVSIASAYFRLGTAAQSVSNRRVNYANLAMLTERTQALYDAGRITFLEVQRALQAQLSAESSLISAQASYETALDSYKILIGMDVKAPLEVVPVELQVDVPDIDNQDVIALATKYRLDLQTARDQIDDARRQVAVAENGLLPDLNLNAQANVGNESNARAAQVNERTGTYAAGLTLGLPIDRLAERNQYRASLISLERSQRDYVDAEQQVESDVRDSVRSIHSAQVTLQIQRLGIELARRRVEFANELLIEGQASSRDVVEAQSSLLSAQDQYEQARASLEIQVLQFLRETGTLRVDPHAGALGAAMERMAQSAGKTPATPPSVPLSRTSASSVEPYSGRGQG